MMICPQCGRDNPADVYYCQACATPLMPAQQPGAPGYYGYPPQQSQAAYPGYEPTHYASIGRRFLAALIDGIILGIPIGIISSVLSAMMAVRVIHRSSRDTSFNPGLAADAIGTFFAGFGIIMIISFLLTWAYFALMESSGWQGTIGKKIMDIRVTDLAGGKISVGRATARLAVKAFLSGWFLIGYIMAFFTRRKQALHDLIAGTLVLSRQPDYPPYPAAYPQAQPGYPNYNQPQPPQQPSYNACPHCGAALQPNARFCSNCGRSL